MKKGKAAKAYYLTQDKYGRYKVDVAIERLTKKIEDVEVHATT